LANPAQVNLSICAEIAFELSVQGGMGQAYRKSQTCLQHALSYVPKQENVLRGKALHLYINTYTIKNYFKPKKNQYPETSFNGTTLVIYNFLNTQA